jgi:hypothetical protein
LQIRQFKWEGQGRVSHLFWKNNIWSLLHIADPSVKKYVYYQINQIA